jgi:hypothetical protein
MSREFSFKEIKFFMIIHQDSTTSIINYYVIYLLDYTITHCISQINYSAKTRACMQMLVIKKNISQHFISLNENSLHLSF